MKESPELMSETSDQQTSRRKFIKSISLTLIGGAVSGCEAIDPCATGKAISIVTGVAGVVAQQTGNYDLARIAGYTTVVVNTLTIIACYQASERQKEEVLRKRTKLKAAGKKYNSRYVATKVQTPSKSQTRDYTPEGAKLVENKQRPAASANIMIYDTKEDRIVGTNAYEAANPKAGEKVPGFGSSPVYCGF